MAEEILRTLEAFGFEWHGPVLRQSARLDAYRAALDTLHAAGRSFECSCSRRDVTTEATEAGGYPGTCRNGATRAGPTATRFRVPPGRLVFADRFQGRQECDLERLGDPVIRRRDGIVAYHLAVVVDDAWQGVTSVVRGADLLASTPWHLVLQSALGQEHPEYGHLPLVTEPDGGKLAKSRRSVPLEPATAPARLCEALALLRQEPPAELARAGLAEVWRWALAHWSPGRLAGIGEARLPR